MVIESKKLKERSIYIYLPTTKMADEWKKRAEKQKLSISKFVIEHVLEAIRKEDGETDSVSKAELSKELTEAREQINNLTKEIKLYKQLAEKLDSELRYYRTTPFVEEGFRGERSFDKQLIELLETKGSIDADRLLDELGIDPKNTEMVKRVRSQLNLFEEYKMIRSTPRGWKWIQSKEVAEKQN